MPNEPDNVEVIEAMEFEHVKAAADIVKRAIAGIKIIKEKGEFQKLDLAVKDLEEALEHLRKFTCLINTEHDIVVDLKEDSKKMIRRL